MPGKQMLCCILISIISEGDMKIFISLFLFIISTSSFADDITHAGVVRIEGLITDVYASCRRLIEIRFQ